MTLRFLTYSLVLIVALIIVILIAMMWLLSPASTRQAVDLSGSGIAFSPALVGEMPAALPSLAAPATVSGVVTGEGGQPNATEAVALLPTIRPWPTMQHTPTCLPPTPIPPTPIPPTPLPAIDPPQRVAVNGIPWESIVVMPPDVVAHAREIFAAGQALGRNAHAYSKVGDSTVENPHFLARFDEGTYNLGAYAHLQPVIDHFHGSHGRDSIAVRIGLHAWTANDPAWAEPDICLPNETPVQCEIRVHNPAVILIRLGTNDVGVGSMFDANMRQIVDVALANGVIPVIGTKGDRHEGSNENNDILRRIAADYRIPLWDYDLVANTLPGRGLDVDAAHMLTFYAHDYNDPTAFTRGHAMHNLTALMALDAVWRETMNQ
jgi:hypothetical protein